MKPDGNFGWCRKILEVDLSDESIKEISPPYELLRCYLGGRGLGVRLVYDNGRVTPLSPDNLLVFAAGPLTGTPTPASGRASVVTRSPATGTIFDANAGGKFGYELKRAGFDAIVLKGRADRPVILEIEDDEVEIRNGDDLWGCNLKETIRIMRQQGTGSIAAIGRAGERLLSIASIGVDGSHYFARGGVGAVMGSKKLKAIRIKGNGRISIFDEDAFSHHRRTIQRMLVASPTIDKGLKVFGTPVLVKIAEWMGILPVDNFRGGKFDARPLYGSRLRSEYPSKRRACPSCPIGCKREERGGGELPEYETIAMFGPNLLNDDLDLIIEANRICNDYGIDTISSGSIIATHGISDPCEIPGLVEEIGEGKIRLKGEVAVKGLELPGYDPRRVMGLGFSYATSNRGGCHTRAYMVAPEILKKPKAIDPLTLSGKAGYVKVFQDRFAAVDSLVVCKFAFFGVTEEEYANILTAVTGVEFRSEDLMMVGERIWNLERLYNIREGFGRADDTLPVHFFDGFSRDAFERTLDEYYAIRGWDENGVPKEETLMRLGLK
ncbi:MAG TPA: aldehyde ferredoxin oxidoreductase [Candidatus Syntrophoarchaeum butanivorans]|uniref:Aldehyde ferredoxin oxidoreductase n=1 Tax=Candidatus Syntropharchaeum butanivorans TaxID=1839936 RepID=A0A1F2P3E6_9EURY|nr:MAG: aldehyde:ferredoxin oxidoreductase [Candidatus Syntrophoarchaeum butanivorans]HEC57719.1 aldehyde ferredoxin oxidoreductase [Candidatus Syntrophoarchaeum butanivorans]